MWGGGRPPSPYGLSANDDKGCWWVLKVEIGCTTHEYKFLSDLFFIMNDKIDNNFCPTRIGISSLVSFIPTKCKSWCVGEQRMTHLFVLIWKNWPRANINKTRESKEEESNLCGRGIRAIYRKARDQVDLRNKQF